VKIEINKNDLNVDINKELNRFDRADQRGQKLAVSYASTIASDVRETIIPSITKKYKASTHNSVNLHLIGNGFAKDSRNRKMIGFSLKSVTNSWKRATLTSYPLNLYEHDTKVYTKRNPWIRATYNDPITYKREGTHILERASSKLGSIAKMSESEFLAEVQNAIKEVMEQ